MAIGLIWAVLTRAEAALLWSAFLITGVLGGFTTFSTFLLDTVLLFEQGAWQTASAYIALSVVSCVVGAGLEVGSIRALG